VPDCYDNLRNACANGFFVNNLALQLPAPDMSGKQNDRFNRLLQAAKEKLSDEEIEMLGEHKELMLEKQLLMSSAIEALSLEQLRDGGVPLGVASLLKKAFRGNLHGLASALVSFSNAAYHRCCYDAP
jgi:hypothetical protein